MKHSFYPFQSCNLLIVQFASKKKKFNFFLYASFSWPFDWNTLVGYVFALFFEFLTIMNIEFCIIPTLGLFIGVCWLSIAFAKDITRDLSLMSTNEATIQNQRSRLKFEKHFCEVIQAYSDARQLNRENIKLKRFPEKTSNFCFFFSLIDEVNRIFEFFPTGLILWSLLAHCVSLLLIEIQLVKYN